MLPQELLNMIFDDFIDFDTEYLDWDMQWNPKVGAISGQLLGMDNRSTSNFLPNKLLAINTSWRATFMPPIVERNTWRFMHGECLKPFVFDGIGAWAPRPELLITKVWLKALIYQRNLSPHPMIALLEDIGKGCLFPKLKVFMFEFEEWMTVPPCSYMTARDYLEAAVVDEIVRLLTGIKVKKAEILGMADSEAKRIEAKMMGLTEASNGMNEPPKVLEADVDHQQRYYH